MLPLTVFTNLHNWCISVFRFNEKHDCLSAVVFDDRCVYSQLCVDHDSQFTHLVFCTDLLSALLCKHLMGTKYFVYFIEKQHQVFHYDG